MPKLTFWLVAFFFWIFLFGIADSVSADYTFSDNFNIGISPNWITITNHVQPVLVEGKLEFNSPEMSDRFPYLAHQYSSPIENINFDFFESYTNLRPWFNGRTSGCQSFGGSSILPGRTNMMSLSCTLAFKGFIEICG